MIPLMGLLASLISFTSPDRSISAQIQTYPDRVEYNLSCDGKMLIKSSAISMTLNDGSTIPSGNVQSVKRCSEDFVFETPLYRKSQVRDHFNELRIVYRNSAVVFRLYDDAFAWRFETSARKAFKVLHEQSTFSFPHDWKMYASYTHKYAGGGLKAQLCDDFENVYAHTKLSEWDLAHYANCPLMVEADGGVKMVITEADLNSYPGMFLYNPDSGTTLVGVNAGVPSKMEVSGHNRLQEMVLERHDYIASCDGTARSFPWRIVCVSRNDAEMADNDAVIRLAAPCDTDQDFSWVRPGRVAWDWLNAWGLRGMDFIAGINTPTYKYYIDFASRHGLEYVILDEGWSVKYANDLLKVVPEIDLEEIVRYGNEKNVGIILWAGHYPFQKDMEKVCAHYSQIGVKGFKVDFMNRDDQLVEDFMRKAAMVCARYHLLLDFHGTHKPVGLQREFPNVINCEGIFGMEQMRGKTLPAYDMVKTDVIFPFVRYVAGFADYTPGLMRNASKYNHRTVKGEPMSQGTRCHQLALYVVYDAPLNMLADSPSNYEQESECLEFISAVPTVWDETRILEGEVGKYIVTARRKGDIWYIGAICDWDGKDITLDLSSLTGGKWIANCYLDGYIADKIASDYRHKHDEGDGTLSVHMAPGGGFAAIVKVND